MDLLIARCTSGMRPFAQHVGLGVNDGTPIFCNGRHAALGTTLVGRRWFPVTRWSRVAEN